jgi:hypothetical protein
MNVSYVYTIDGKEQPASTTVSMPPESLIAIKWNFNGKEYRIEFNEKKYSRLLISDKYEYLIVMYYPYTADNISIYSFEKQLIKQLALPQLAADYFIKNSKLSEASKGVYFFGINSIENDEDHICISICTNVDSGKGELVEDRLFDLRDLEFKNSIGIWYA